MLGYVVNRIGAYRIVEGTGRHGGYWYAIARGDRVRCASRRAAEDHAEASTDC